MKRFLLQNLVTFAPAINPGVLLFAGGFIQGRGVLAENDYERSLSASARGGAWKHSNWTKQILNFNKDRACSSFFGSFSYFKLMFNIFFELVNLPCDRFTEFMFLGEPMEIGPALRLVLADWPLSKVDLR